MRFEKHLSYGNVIFHFFFQLGVNGYSFIVDNNGRVLYHPDLRTDVIHKFEARF